MKWRIVEGKEFILQFKQRLVFFVGGCAFVLLGQVATSLIVPRATAQSGPPSAEFSELTVRSLRVVDESGAIRVRVEVIPDDEMNQFAQALNSDDWTDQLISASNSQGEDVFSLSADNDGASIVVPGVEDDAPGGGILISSSDGSIHAGSVAAKTVSVYSGDGATAAYMQGGAPDQPSLVVGGQGGPAVAVWPTAVSVSDGDERVATMWSEASGGRMAVYQTGGAPAASMLSEAAGGRVSVYQTGGTAVAAIATGPEGGSVSVAHADGAIAASVLADTHGGAMRVFDKGNNLVRAAVGVNATGTGAVGLWDKDNQAVR